jgi:hypothetical protein
MKKNATLEEYNEHIFEREFFELALQSALAKDWTFESPKDDEAVALVVGHWELVFALWRFPAARFGYRLTPISGWDTILARTAPTNTRFNAVLVKDEATALKWQAAHGDPSWWSPPIAPRARRWRDRMRPTN